MKLILDLIDFSGAPDTSATSCFLPYVPVFLLEYYFTLLV
jgi:hypothetical protein